MADTLATVDFHDICDPSAYVLECLAMAKKADAELAKKEAAAERAAAELLREEDAAAAARTGTAARHPTCLSHQRSACAEVWLHLPRLHRCRSRCHPCLFGCYPTRGPGTAAGHRCAEY